MTTIAYDGRIVSGDGRRCAGNEHVRDDAEKITVINTKDHKAVYAMTGPSALRLPIIEWIKAGAAPKEAPVMKDDDSGWTMLVIKPDGRAVYYTSAVPYPAEATVPFAMGSGAAYAVGAMRLGHDAAEAVSAAFADLHTGGRIQSVDIASEFARKTTSTYDAHRRKNVIRLEEPAA